MCGIFGFYNFTAKPASMGTLHACTHMLAHRGPDMQDCVGLDIHGQWHQYGEKYGCDGNNEILKLGLGHCRLSIIDLSENGRQPMEGKKGVRIVYNGEIYNYIEIRSELKRLGHQFRTDTDTEVILAAYDQWGTNCVDRFNGMWAFAVYDPSKNGIFCSRDRLGIKPFYYHYSERSFCFSSELYPIFQYFGQVPGFDETLLARYLVYHRIDCTSKTIYKDISELQGGHSLWVDLKEGKKKEWRYWDLPESNDIEANSQQVLDRFSEILEDSVRLRLRSDVPIAVALSGGVDSSAIALAACRTGIGQISTFTSHFPQSPEIDESKYALLVAEATGALPNLVEPDLNKLVDEEPHLTKHQGMPYQSLSLYVHWAILDRIKQSNITVVLSGQTVSKLNHTVIQKG